MYLVDTNVWLELLLDQEHAADVRRFFDVIPSAEIALTEFTLYSIGIILTRLSKDALFKEFISDILDVARVQRVRLETHGFAKLLHVRAAFRLDFDDAYQYAAAEMHDMTLVSLDADFDKTARGRCSPQQVTSSRTMLGRQHKPPQ